MEGERKYFLTIRKFLVNLPLLSIIAFHPEILLTSDIKHSERSPYIQENEDQSDWDTPLIMEDCQDIDAVALIGKEQTSDPYVLATLFNLRGRQLEWLGYQTSEDEVGGVDFGTDLMPNPPSYAFFELYSQGKVKYYLMFYKHEDDRYSVWIVNKEMTTGFDGGHLGNHPPGSCQPIEIRKKLVNEFLDYFD